MVDGRLVLKFAWSEVRAARLWREGLIMCRLCRRLPVPEPVLHTEAPALVATRLVAGVPLRRDWAAETVGAQVGEFLGRLHALDAGEVLAGLAPVVPTAQAGTGALRRRFGRFVDDRRTAQVVRWCDWVDGVLAEPAPFADVVLHGDLHGHNQVWDEASATLLAVVDFEECGAGDPHFDLRYLPSFSADPGLTLAVIDAYRRCTGRRLDIARVMAWHTLTHLGDALWRSEAGVELPGGGTPPTYVDDLAARFADLGLPG